VLRVTDPDVTGCCAQEIERKAAPAARPTGTSHRPAITLTAPASNPNRERERTDRDADDTADDLYRLLLLSGTWWKRT
jgi:hypothetical protein